MSSASLFEFDTGKDVGELFNTLCNVWQKGLPYRDVLIYSQSVPQTRFALIGKSEGTNQIAEQFARLTEREGRRLEDSIQSKWITRASPGEVTEETQLAAPKGEREWVCYLGWYFGTDQDKRDLPDSVGEICGFAEGDIYYFRDPDFFAEYYGSGYRRLPDAIIELDDLLRYQPQVQDQVRYRIRCPK